MGKPAPILFYSTFLLIGSFGDYNFWGKLTFPSVLKRMFLRQNLRPTIRPTIRPNLRWPQNPNIRLAPNIRLGPEVRLFARYSAIYPNIRLILTIFWCFKTKIYHFGCLFLTNIRLIWPNVRYLPNLRPLTEGPAPAKCSVIWPAGGPAPAGGQNSTFVLTLHIWIIAS